MKGHTLIGLLWVAACVDAPLFVPYQNTRVLSEALAPNATLVTLGPDVSSENSRTTSHDLQSRVKVLPLTEGFVAVVAASREEVVWDDALRTLGLVRAGATGIRTLEVVAARSVWASLGDEAIVVTCDADGVGTAYLSDAAAGFIELTSTDMACGAHVSGRAAEPDQALFLRSGTLMRWSVDRGARSISQEEFSEPPELPDPTSILFLEETTAGALSWVTLASDTLTYQRAGDTLDATEVGGLDGDVQVYRGADGALRVATSAGLWRWAVDDAEAPTKLADAPAAPAGTTWTPFAAPGGAYAWATVPNPLNPSELYPTAATLRFADDNGFVTFSPSATPCCSSDACRQAAESYVIGGFGSGASRLVFYDLWTWVGDNEHAMVVAGAPLACEP